MKLIGEVLSLDTRADAFDGDDDVIVTVRTDAGDELAFHAFHTVARTELSRARPKVGYWIGVKYGGKHENGYHVWRVALDRDAEPEWDRIGAQAEAELNANGAEDRTDAGDDDLPF